MQSLIWNAKPRPAITGNRVVDKKLLVQVPSLNCNIEAMYATIVGIVLPDIMRCQKSADGNGPLLYCGILPSYLKGACSDCHRNNGGAKCTFRQSQISGAVAVHDTLPVSLSC
ncbi:hypothetical protein PG993_009718 [Apiospora rasikravindrae]|uniref:Uncharacterized protein n=1 Tax=Apiospora rasikravindrae TaxID=990691 RepID=A0ABR1SK64_9PEZI